MQAGISCSKELSAKFGVLAELGPQCCKHYTLFYPGPIGRQFPGPCKFPGFCRGGGKPDLFFQFGSCMLHRLEIVLDSGIFLTVYDHHGLVEI